ncbi:alpha-ribazole phosphatase family protein [Serpens gallinarum]|uniref:Alpha-ribazole phosphatase family protein n=1 Tax=Serpens gallinarum TaxID=2763075 RepID=A0ABR8TRN6_9PSED|nr:alpha-ribazole phosphatase family protein [Serpens gallinarum]MBD7978118.1 alpha-ribazole phosphatase family protein [Serpens gallinarum]
MSLCLDLLRHGETTAGSGFFGSSDVPLSESGWQQLRAAVLGGDWDVLVSSPLQRCRAFAEELAQQTSLPLQIEAGLRELHFGAWEGRNAAQIMLEDEHALGAFWNDPYGFTPPDGEPLLDFASRVLGAVERLHWELAGQRALLLTHGGVMRLLLARARGLPEAQLLQVEVGHGALHRLWIGAGLALREG